MRYSVPYWFSACGTSYGGTEEVCAKSPEGAVVKAQERHPNVKLRVGVVREREGEYAGRKIAVNQPSKSA